MKVKITRSVVITAVGWVEADSLESAVQAALDHEDDSDWEYYYDTAEAMGEGEGEDAQVYWVEGEDSPDPTTPEPTHARSYALARGMHQSRTG